MGAPYGAIIANHPHIPEILRQLQSSSKPLLMMDIRRILPHIPSREMLRALYYLANNGYCDTCMIVTSHRSRPYRAYGPITNFGTRLLTAASA